MAVTAAVSGVSFRHLAFFIAKKRGYSEQATADFLSSGGLSLIIKPKRNI